MKGKTRNKAKTLLTAHYAHMMEYRAEIFLWALSNSLPIILMGVWIKASQGGNFALSTVDFARYFFAAFLVRQFTTVWVIWEFEREVLEGSLSFRLLQPIDPVWHHVTRHIAEKMTRLPLICVFIGLFFWLYPEASWIPSLGQIIRFIVVIITSFALTFTVQYTFSMFAFWIERASSIQQFWFLFYIFLSGAIAPLEVFPEGLRNFVQLTPFPYLMHFPAAILTGLEVNFGRGLIIMLIWIFIFYLANRWLWKKGLKQYSGMGA